MNTETLAKLIKEENEQTRRHFDDKAAEMGRHFDEKAAETQQHFDDKAAEMGRHFDEKADETQRHFDEKAAESLRHFDEKAAESQRHFDVVAESLKSDIRLIAEGHGVLFEKMDRLETQVENFALETRANFEEVRAAIKFSYAELDRRVAHLESGFLDLSTRVQRIESRQTA